MLVGIDLSQMSEGLDTYSQSQHTLDYARRKSTNTNNIQKSVRDEQRSAQSVFHSIYIQSERSEGAPT